ncbi:phosphoenolpyruvate--protein phosphotransferase [Shewanella oncorhynchi]|uniref:Phosphoenolpyruvate-protein phosphotransferase n=1 Tax=Shewanella oncorhynchi TaxID=2726434 RepID=A0ABX1KSP2_9GAMM|nr:MULTISPECIES: phosphoenolpyruvate--protein phosphotransferase [Shewanella]MBS0043912.1 phosphoenolpyruvate--protein phosphotransferase [Shewanella sp. M16]MCU8028592.1 phosphoenolpyruvate--protein phosphotransferase [Shewanella sp. SM73]NLQ25225.1 phosphoenolpyruvate--protein phosphotransferase [Shewanella oncorhynchi]
MSITGIIVSSGIAFGQALHLLHTEHHLDYRPIPLSKIPQQQGKFAKALQELQAQLTHSQAALDSDSENYQLIEADLLLLEDDELIEQVNDAIRTLQLSASVAVERIFAHQANELQSLDDPYLANRAQDVRCLGQRVVAAINGHLAQGLEKLDRPTILLAQDLTPAEFALLPRENLCGIVLKTGGLTSHTAILARAAGIPAMLSCQFDADSIPNGTPLVLDALAGELCVNPNPDQQARLTVTFHHEQARRAALQTYKDVPAQTQDGHTVGLMANVGNLNDITHVSDVGADGIGLFRTEFMLMNVATLPDEKAQYSLYCDALHALGGKTFTIRTLDIGADKELPCLCQEIEDNPALGLRGIRYTLAHPELFKTQLRAILRAANHGPIRLMFPMVNQVEELDEVFALIAQCQDALEEEEKGYGELSYGIVVETPAAVFNLNAMLPRLDFVSIGTNDLTQYAMAADRTNPQLTRDYPSLSPAILALINMTITQAKAANVKVSLCGELASSPQIAPLLIGMGLDELSVNLSSLLEVKAAICQGSITQFSALAHTALQQDRIASLQQCITSYK